MEKNILLNKPTRRKLQAYAFDPSPSLKMDTAAINHMVYMVPWEDLDVGPIGEYLEVIDYDPTVGRFYTPVDLNHPYLLAQDGLEPSESNPQFHQQMVYAVAMTTIKNFEKALGRRILWAPRLLKDPRKFQKYVPKLRIYPHAIREANAYYSPVKKAILFGYFSASPANNTLHMPDALVFTCLSHDIIAHEVTHAILDGLHYHYNEASNPDVLAFHEAFADIVALFQHFTFPEVLKHQIASTRGNLESQNMLGKLAQEFGEAIGSYGSLREAIGEVDQHTKEWKVVEPNPDDYKSLMEPHKRGSILVAAVFEAFLTIYKAKVADLLRIATNGTGILPQGELQPDLVNRMAIEASKASSQVLNICIRALDYCPPVDITFGEYLRAIITADVDLVAVDDKNYRLAFIDAFRRRGIYPVGIKTLSVDSLRYSFVQSFEEKTRQMSQVISDFLRDYLNEMAYEKDNRKKIYSISQKYLGGTRKIKGLHKRLYEGLGRSDEFEKITGVVLGADGWESLGIKTSADRSIPIPSFRVQDLRLVSRVGPDGNQIKYVIFSLIQRAGVVVSDTISTYIPNDDENAPENGFELWGGCTLIFDPETSELKYAISKPLLDPDKLREGSKVVYEKRARNQFRFQTEQRPMYLSEHSLYFGFGMKNHFNEPFALLHNH